MSSRAVRFNTQDRPEFFRALNKRVNAHFKEKGVSRHGNFNMWFKSAFMLTLYTAPFLLMVTGAVSGIWPILGMWALMGLGMSGIGLSIMHDANHNSYSSDPKVNKFMGFLLNYIGGYHVNWIIQHNVLHHSYTNIEGHDEDIETAIMRQAPGQERKKLHRFQAFYAPVFYGLMTIYWLLSKDFEQLVRYNSMGLLEAQGKTMRRAVAETVIYKLLYVGLFLILPIIVVDLPWWQTLLGFLFMQYLSGLILALVFQPAHVIEETDFYQPSAEGSVENSWAIHQLHTTANYAPDNRMLSWFVGGLNYQVEHHLFPHICHVHYRELSPIVKATAEEYGIPYYEHPTFYRALKSHFTLLHRLGTGQYDEEVAMA